MARRFRHLCALRKEDPSVQGPPTAGGQGCARGRALSFPENRPRVQEHRAFTQHRKKFGCVECHHTCYFEATAHLGRSLRTTTRLSQLSRRRPHRSGGHHRIAAYRPGRTKPRGRARLDSAHDVTPSYNGCYDCHSGTEDVVSHTLPLTDETPGCKPRHTRDSGHARLYRYGQKVRRTVRFTHPVMVRDSYLMGATRYIPLDCSPMSWRPARCSSCCS
jgi:hypothetical protein